MSTEFSSHVIVPLTAITHVTCLKGEKKTFICSSLNLLINFMALLMCRTTLLPGSKQLSQTSSFAKPIMGKKSLGAYDEHLFLSAELVYIIGADTLFL
jgi:hypothetical protein